jgi:hypothetical protein
MLPNKPIFFGYWAGRAMTEVCTLCTSLNSVYELLPMKKRVTGKVTDIHFDPNLFFKGYISCPEFQGDFVIDFLPAESLFGLIAIYFLAG